MRPFLFFLPPPCVPRPSPPGTGQTLGFGAAGLRPFWLSTTMHGESVLFIKDAEDGPPQGFAAV